MVDSTTQLDEGHDPDTAVSLRRKKRKDSLELDITPMIDITFLLLIYFLVASIPDRNEALELPEARHGTGVSRENSVRLTVEAGGLGLAIVKVDGGGELSRSDAETQNGQIRDAVQEGAQRGKTSVLIQAERGVAHRDVARVAQAAGDVDGVSLHVGVLEVE